MDVNFKLQNCDIREIKDYKLVVSIPTTNPEDECEQGADIVDVTENGIILSEYIKSLGTNEISHSDLYKMLLMGWAWLS